MVKNYKYIVTHDGKPVHFYTLNAAKKYAKKVMKEWKREHVEIYKFYLQIRK